MQVFEKEIVDVSNSKTLGDYSVIKENNGILVIEKNSNYGLANLNGKVIYDITLNEVLQIKDGLAVVDNPKGKKYSVVDSMGNIILSSNNMFRIENNFIIEIIDYCSFNNYNIYDKKGNLIMNEIGAFNDSRLVRRIEDGFDKLYYELYDLKGNKVIELNSSFKINEFIESGIIKYRKKNKVYILDVNGIVINEFKGIYVKIIDDNRYLVYGNSHKWKLVDDKKNIFFKSNKHADIDYENKVVMVCHEYAREGFINRDNKFINTRFKFHDAINKDYLKISDSSYIKVIDLNGNVLLNVENIEDNDIYYNSDFELYMVCNNGAYTIFDNKFNEVFKCDAYDMKIVTDKLFLVQERYDSSIILINSSNQLLYTFSKDLSDLAIDIEIKDNLIKLENSKKMVFNLDGDIIIPETDENIVLLSLNRLIVGNKLIDLSCEYLNIKKYYSVMIELFDKKIVRKFNSIKEKKLFIEEALKIEREYSNKIELIKDEAIGSVSDIYEKVKIR